MRMAARERVGAIAWDVLKRKPEPGLVDDWRTWPGAYLTLHEREWLHYVSSEIGKGFDNPVIVHIGVFKGASLHCSAAGAPHARLVGVDVDTRLYRKGDAELIQAPSQTTWRNFDGPVHFLFVDGAHDREGVYGDIAGWAGKVTPGGIIAFHDYNADAEHLQHTQGVRDAVDAWNWAPTTWEEIPGADSIKAYRRKAFLHQGQGFGTIAIGVPYYKAEYEFFRWWSWLLAGGLEDGDQLLNTADVPGEMPIPLVHNALVRQFLRTDRDTLCIVEDDHSGPQDALRKMRFKPENQAFDIVCASYTNRRPPLTAVGARLKDMNEYGEWNCEIRGYEVARTGTQEHSVAALGLVLIRRHVLVRMLGDNNPEDYFWFEWRGRNSQDVQFYGNAQEVGARVGVDRDNPIAHIGKKKYTMNEYYEMMDQARRRKPRYWPALVQDWIQRHRR